MTEHLIFIPQAEAWINSNDRHSHWAVRHRRTKAWRQAACWIARRAKVPRYEAVHVTALIHKKTRRRFDPANTYPTVKAVVDGALVDAGVIDDDSTEYLIGPDMRAGVTSATDPGITLIITPTPVSGPESRSAA